MTSFAVRVASSTVAVVSLAGEHDAHDVAVPSVTNVV
jgi:hypothetical protein